MNYKRIYDELIEARRLAPVPDGYTETHHITPKSLGGNNDADNLIALTPEDHFMCHRLLAKIHGGKMSQAFWFMCHRNTISARDVYISPRVQAKARENAAKAHSETMSGENSPFYGRHHSANAIKKMSEARLGKKASDETRQKMSEAQRGENNHFYGKTLSAEHRAKMSESMRGKHHSAESRAKMSKARRGSGNPAYDSTQYIFQHPEHGERICTQYELRTEFSLAPQSLSGLIRGRLRTTGGWRFLGPAV